jgi:hypothetical protein
LPQHETPALREAVRAIGLDVDLVVVNAIVPDRFSAEEADALEAARPAGDVIRMAISAHKRARAQADELDRLRAGLDGTPVATLPLLFTAALDADGLSELARELDHVL